METELKFQVPRAARAALRRAVATTSAQVTRMEAVYADTDDDRLAAAGLALRLRREGTQWVQALKGRGDGVMQRLEHEVPLDATDAPALPDPALHAGTAAGEALQRALDGAVPRALFRTEVRRTHRRVRSGGATIEIAFDEGRIVAGAQSVEVCEIEFELISGLPAVLPAFAERWVRRHGLWLDVRSKAERGWRLARGQPVAPPLKACPAELPAAAGCAEAFAAMVQTALAQALPNAAALAASLGEPEHLHQLRVGLRRLRTVLRLFGGWSGNAAAAQTLEAALREPFAQLGAARDDDVLRQTVLPLLEAAGAPRLMLAAPSVAKSSAKSPAQDPEAVVRGIELNRLWLQALHLAWAAPGACNAQPEPLPPLHTAARKVLKAAHRRVARDAEGFVDASPESQHRTRKRLKRLRYATEFLQPLMPGSAVRRALKAQRKALDEIGAYTDLLLAQAHFKAQKPADAGIGFALGWLAAQRPQRLRRAAAGLRKVAGLPRYWA